MILPENPENLDPKLRGCMTFVKPTTYGGDGDGGDDGDDDGDDGGDDGGGDDEDDDDDADDDDDDDDFLFAPDGVPPLRAYTYNSIKITDLGPGSRGRSCKAP